MSEDAKVEQNGLFSRPSFNYAGAIETVEAAQTVIAESSRNVLEAILCYLRQNQVLSRSIARDITRTRIALEKLVDSKRRISRRRRKK